MKISSVIKGYWVLIMFDEIIHVAFKQSELKGFQTWIEAKDCFDIYLYFGDQEKIHLSYSKKEVWVKVIDCLKTSL